jgi:hypothetical protein
MTRSNTTDRTIYIRTGTVEVPVDEYELNDLDGEITRTLAACEGLCDSMSGPDQALRTVFGN